MKTKDRIAEKALQLFNRYGAAEVTARRISEELEISYGNFCYHFPNKDELLLHLYGQFQAESDEQYRQLGQEIFGFDFMARSLRSLLETMYRYRFLYTDASYLLRRYESIRRHVQETHSRRLQFLESLAEFLAAGDYLRQDKVEGHNRRLIRGLLILLNGWVPDAVLFYEGKPEALIDDYLELLYAAIRPSLSKKGLQAFDEVYRRDLR
jgi:AcrR family transcriptional regulator